MIKKLPVILPLQVSFLLILILGCVPGKNSRSDDLAFKGPVVSCGHLVVYQLSEDHKSYIQLIVDTNEIVLGQENTWYIKPENLNVRVRFRQFEEDISSSLCNDIASNKRSKPPKEAMGLAGKISLTMTTSDWQKYKKGTGYKVDINAKGLKFNEEKTYSLNIYRTLVGWLPG